MCDCELGVYDSGRGNLCILSLAGALLQGQMPPPQLGEGLIPIPGPGPLQGAAALPGEAPTGWQPRD